MKEINEIFEAYRNVINAWKKRGDVLSGKDLAYNPYKHQGKPARFDNTPLGFGTGTGTTGWCVSASQSLLEDPIFQELLRIRSAQAKLISIDIKEQYYGFCFNGSQNIWHTAILVYDTNYYFIIDITCRQFGNDFVGKDFWTFETWQEKLRSPRCSHRLTDFDGNQFGFTPVLVNTKSVNKDFHYSEMFNQLHSYTNLNNDDRHLITDFLINQINKINNKLLVRSLNIDDYKYLQKVAETFKSLEYVATEKCYGVLKFNNKAATKNWLEHFFNNNCKLDMFLQVYRDLESYSMVNNFDLAELHKKVKSESEPHYLIIEFNNQYGIKTSDFFRGTDMIIPYGTPLEVVITLNGHLKPELDNIINQYGFDELTINEFMAEKLDSIQEKDKLNTSWIIINSI